MPRCVVVARRELARLHGDSQCDSGLFLQAQQAATQLREGELASIGLCLGYEADLAQVRARAPAAAAAAAFMRAMCWRGVAHH